MWPDHGEVVLGGAPTVREEEEGARRFWRSETMRDGQGGAQGCGESTGKRNLIGMEQRSQIRPANRGEFVGVRVKKKTRGDPLGGFRSIGAASGRAPHACEAPRQSSNVLMRERRLARAVGGRW